MNRVEIGNYLYSVLDLLPSTGGSITDIPLYYFDENIGAGIIRARVLFDDASTLQVVIAVVWNDDYPDWVDYSLHYMDIDRNTRFRYDNTPHWPGLPFFPQHKHVGPDEEPIGHLRPSIREMLSEIDTMVHGM